MPDITLLLPNTLDSIFLYPFSVVHPIPPTGLTAIYTTKATNRNNRRIKLTWVAPVDMPDIVSYNIYRNDAKIADFPLYDQGLPIGGVLEYMDESTGGDVDFFTYYITSVDSSGVESEVSLSICNFSQRLNKFIDDLRRSLKDSPPDPRVQRWTDDDLLLYLNMGLSRVNSIPLNTDFNFDSAPRDLYNYILVAARIAALRSQASLEAAKEMTMSVGGLNVMINRSAPYASLLNSEESSWQKEMENIKRNFTMRLVHGEGLLSSELPFRIRTFAPRQFRIR